MYYKLEIVDLETSKQITNLHFNSNSVDVNSIMQLVSDRSDMPKHIYGVLWLDHEPVSLLDHDGNVISERDLNRRKLELFLD